MTDLPTGTVTFLFTDIEGSTGLLQALGDRYGAVLDEHAAILRRALADHGGVEVSTHGDAFFVVFRGRHLDQATARPIGCRCAVSPSPWPACRRLPSRCCSTLAPSSLRSSRS